jgi:hypothetical protein
MKQFNNLLLWIALYFVRLPFERIQIVRAFRLHPAVRFHWVGGYEPRHSLRPIHLLLPVALGEFILLLIVIRLTPVNAFIFGFIGNLVIVGLAMLPSVGKAYEHE